LQQTCTSNIEGLLKERYILHAQEKIASSFCHMSRYCWSRFVVLRHEQFCTWIWGKHWHFKWYLLI